MSKIARELKTAQMHKAKHPSANIATPPTPLDIATPPEPQSEELADILQMAEESGRRSMQRVRPKMERAIRAALKNSTD